MQSNVACVLFRETVGASRYADVHSELLPIGQLLPITHVLRIYYGRGER